MYRVSVCVLLFKSPKNERHDHDFLMILLLFFVVSIIGDDDLFLGSWSQSGVHSMFFVLQCNNNKRKKYLCIWLVCVLIFGRKTWLGFSFFLLLLQNNHPDTTTFTFFLYTMNLLSNNDSPTLFTRFLYILRCFSYMMDKSTTHTHTFYEIN